MSVQRRVNWLSQQRVDVTDMRSIESAGSNDFDQLFQGLITNTSQGYIIRGFNILMSGVGSNASNLLMQVDPGAVAHILASQSGTILMVPVGTPNQQLNSAVNVNVVGAFTPSSINYVTLDYVRYIDPSTDALVYLWDPNSDTEITKVAPRAQILQFVINISTLTPTSNLLPIATVTTDSANNATVIEDSRWLMFSNSVGGLSPTQTYTYPWVSRTANPESSSSSLIDPFTGNDKSIDCLKSWMDAAMSIMREIKGTPYWFSYNSNATITSVYQNAALIVLSGGTWVVPSPGHLELKGGSTLTRFGFTNDLTLAPFGPLSSSESLTATVVDNQDVTFSAPAVDTINIGDTLTISSVTLDINSVISQSSVIVDEPGFTNGTGLSATLDHYDSFNLTANQVLYILLPSSDMAVTYSYGADGINPVQPEQVISTTINTVTVNTGGNYATGAGNFLAYGTQYSYTSYTPGTGTFNGVSPDPTVIPTGSYVYPLNNGSTGYYIYSSPTVVPGVVSGISMGAESVVWLAYYDGSSTVFLRNGQLSTGEALPVGDTLSTSILSYIGMPNQATNFPTYSSNIRGIAFENLTNRVGTLTDAIGDEQEDRSAYIRSDSPVTWDGGNTGNSAGGFIFTSPIVLEIVNTKSGTITTHTIAAGNVPLIADGQLAYITVNRLASETVTFTVATSTPAQTQATKDIFVLFKRHDVSGVGFLYSPFTKQLIQPGQTVMLGATGYGPGGARGYFGLDSMSYQAVFTDKFDAIPTDNSPIFVPGTSAVDPTQTNALYSPIEQLFTISYDATRTLNADTSTTMNFPNGAPTFTVKVSDILVFDGYARKITALGSINTDGGTATPFTIESAFPTNPGPASACMVSQGVYTVDINNYTNDGAEESIATAYGTPISDMLLDYDDAATGNEPDLTTTPNVSFTASASGTATDYTPVVTRALISGVENITSLESPGTSLYIRFFANPADTSHGTVNLLNYEAFLHNATNSGTTGFALNQSYCFTDSSETPLNCTQPTVVGGKTQISNLPLYSPRIESW
jgi:hypothetical protein